MIVKKAQNLLKKGSEVMLSDSVWETIKDIIPSKKIKIGRPEKCPRKALEGIIFVLKTGCQWSLVPIKYGNYKTIHKKFIKWTRLGVFKQLMKFARKNYQKRNSKNNWYCFDTTLKKAPFAKFGGKNPTDRAKRGIKHAILVDRKGAPLFVYVAPANKHDSKLFEPVFKQMRKSKKIRIIAADSAFDVRKLYTQCKDKNIALIASTNPRRNKSKHKFNAPVRWIVEQTFGILAWFRGLKNCWNKTFETSYAFLQIACVLRLFKMMEF